MLGYMRSDLVQQNINILVPNPFSENHQDHLLAMLRTGITVSESVCVRMTIFL